jgi:NADPH-dependent curcumin reductase CurA
MNYRQIVLSSRPVGLPTSENFSIEERDLNNLNADEVLLKPWYFSVDPYMRGRMNNTKSYIPPYEINEPIAGGSIARVIKSRSDIFAEGDIIVAALPWATYCIEKSENLRKIDSKFDRPTYNLGILGMPGLTAYFGIMEIGKPKKGETVVISAAAGAVGIVAGQIAKIQGSIVIGITGSDEKCKLLKDEFGFDAAVNYKTSDDLDKAITALCPNGIDVYFDNVGGEITDAVISNLNVHSRIIVCGQISQYNNTEVSLVPSILPKLLSKSIMAQGFIVGNYRVRFGEGFAQLTQWVNEGKLKHKETVVRGFDKLPDAFIGLFSGQNQGKMIVEIE